MRCWAVAESVLPTPSEAAPPAIKLRNLSRHFAAVKALDGIDLEIQRGEFFGLLGPSGSGKTTCLRLIAGFDSPTSGSVEIAGARSEHLPPYRRDVATVFQDYALFPHMNVIDNVAYGPMVRGVDKQQRYQSARQALTQVKLDGYEQRRPAELSGGQRQRVALARCLVTQPRVLLLDEPLGALDLKLREQMQVELKSLQQQLGLTFVFVTHDQGEALAMSDRIAIFNNGRVMQTGTPVEIYEYPANAFVADFVGGSNVISADRLPVGAVDAGCYSLRPERLTIGGNGGAIRLTGTVQSVQYLGAMNRVALIVDGMLLTATQPVHTGTAVAVGDSVPLSLNAEDLHRMADE